MLSPEEKAMIGEALQVYVQLVSRQLPPAKTQQLADLAQDIMLKLENLGATPGKAGNKSAGISDEWYNSVCLSCDKLSAAGCTDKVTVKFPGKCDPILHFEMNKAKALKQPS